MNINSKDETYDAADGLVSHTRRSKRSLLPALMAPEEFGGNDDTVGHQRPNTWMAKLRLRLAQG